MKQASFADAEYAGKRKQTRRERFLIEMDLVVPWKGLTAQKSVGTSDLP
jgi:IS5 family transposase